MAALKGGYDCDFLEPPASRLECAVCLLVVREPHVITCCGNQFCWSCIERVQRDGKPCPLCNDSGYNVFPHKGVTREVNELRVRCPHQERGCEWDGRLGDLDQHLGGDGGCRFVEIECVYKCGERFLRNAIREHERNACNYRPVEIVLASVMKKLDKLTTENQEIKVENQKLKDELTGVSGQLQESQQQISWLYTEVRQLKKRSLRSQPPENFEAVVPAPITSLPLQQLNTQFCTSTKRNAGFQRSPVSHQSEACTRFKFRRGGEGLFSPSVSEGFYTTP